MVGIIFILGVIIFLLHKGLQFIADKTGTTEERIIKNITLLYRLFR